ncbi:universal stress protein [Aliamphritea hakodatensis]|uniref:universal stress protein n=1 Tax=Aliamphritea hakodatensis TaxID=2895352 RepID=UPI0022FD3D79|nr:universal stress protein [Aliamphritea hakodatensis]
MYKKLLVAVDLQDAKGTEATLLALNDYVAPGMEVELVAVLPGFKMPLVASYFPEDMVKQALDTMRAELTRLADTHLVKEMNVSVWVTAGKVPKRIVARAGETDADLILIRALKHGRMEKMMMGSVTAKVVQTADRSVLVIR